LFCLTLFLCRCLAVDKRFAARQLALACAAFIALWLIRSAFLGTLTGEVGAANGDYAGNFLNHVEGLGDFTLLLGGVRSFVLLGAALAIALASRRLALGALGLVLA